MALSINNEKYIDVHNKKETCFNILCDQHSTKEKVSP